MQMLSPVNVAELSTQNIVDKLELKDTLKAFHVFENKQKKV